MTLWQAIVLGLVQGMGEFLPISSSAHLVLIPWICNWPDPGLTFDIALHVGTLVSVVAYFWRDWLQLVRGGLKGFKTPEGKLFWFIVAASIPGAGIGFLLEHKAETVFRSPALIAVMLIVMGILLLLADRKGAKVTGLIGIRFATSFCIGISQALAIIPGVSRSGVTMTTGLFAGLTREATARFSFLLRVFQETTTLSFLHWRFDRGRAAMSARVENEKVILKNESQNLTTMSLYAINFIHNTRFREMACPSSLAIEVVLW